VGPLFAEIWPLDAHLRSGASSRNLVLMVQECDGAFPEAVDAIVDVIAPYDLYPLSIALKLEEEHSDLVQQFPRAFLKLVNALVDPALFPVPSDLTGLLSECVAVDPTVVDDPSCVRLYGLRRQRGA
jgi:hypothetical protein